MDIFIGVFVTGGSAAFHLPAQFQLPRAGMGIGQLVQQQAGGLTAVVNRQKRNGGRYDHQINIAVSFYLCRNVSKHNMQNKRL